MGSAIKKGRDTASAHLEELLAGVARGDRESLAQLYKRSRGAVYAAALAILGNSFDAEEVTHDAFVRIWESAAGYRPAGSPMAWMLTITRNLALDRIRRQGRTDTLSPEEWDAIPANAPRVTQEDRYYLQTCLEGLEARERQIVLLHAVSGLKHREIAGLLGLPIGTVLSAYNRALKKLRGKIETEGGAVL